MLSFAEELIKCLEMLVCPFFFFVIILLIFVVIFRHIKIETAIFTFPQLLLYHIFMPRFFLGPH